MVRLCFTQRLGLCCADMTLAEETPTLYTVSTDGNAVPLTRRQARTADMRRQVVDERELVKAGASAGHGFGNAQLAPLLILPGHEWTKRQLSSRCMG